MFRNGLFGDECRISLVVRSKRRTRFGRRRYPLWLEQLEVRLTPSGTIQTIAGNGIAGYSGDGGSATAAELNGPGAVAVDHLTGNVYIADFEGNVVREVIKATGDIITFAGTGTLGFGGDGGPATNAELAEPAAVAVDQNGNVYIADTFNDRVREVSATTGDITTIAGTGAAGSSGDGGLATAAELDLPTGVAVDTNGNVYISDLINNVVREVIKATGDIIAYAGSGTAGYSGDGGSATAAKLTHPEQLALDTKNNLYIADTGNNVVREVIEATGEIITYAGTGTAGTSGDGGLATAAELSGPYGVAVDPSGNVYIATNKGNVVREVDATTKDISTIAGTGTAGFSGDGGPATAAELNDPLGLAVDNNGNLVIADGLNSRVRLVSFQNSDTWSGGGTTSNWTDKNNWVGKTVPTPGETLIFPSGAANFNSVDDIPNLAIDALQIGATYNLTDLNGDALDLDGNLTVTGGDTTYDIPTDLDAQPVSMAAQSVGALAAAAPAVVRTITVDQNAQLTLRSDLDGLGGLVKAGPGKLIIVNATTYTGSTTLSAGTLTIENAGALSQGTLIVNPTAGTSVTIDPNGMTLALKNPLVLQMGVGGKLTVAAGNLQFSGGTTLLSSGEIDPAAESTVILAGSIQNDASAPPGTALTLGGQGNGATELAGTLNTALVVNGFVDLAKTFNGTGAITVQGGQLGSSGIGTYSGQITLNAGTISALANNAFGSGPLKVQVAKGATGTLATAVSLAPITLGNSLTMSGGTLVVKGNATTTINQPVTMSAASEIDPQAGVTLALTGNVTGTGLLTLGGSGTVNLGGKLGAPVSVSAGDTVQLLPAFSGTGNVTVNGGTLKAGGIADYTGKIILTAGTIDVNAEKLAFGGFGAALAVDLPAGKTGKLVVSPAGATLGNNLTLDGAGKLNIVGNVSFTGTVTLPQNNGEIDPATGTNVTLSGELIGNLTVGGAGAVLLGGKFNVGFVTVVAPGTVKLLGTLNGAGGVNVNGGTLSSATSNKLKGDVAAFAGKVELGATNALGMGLLFFGKTGNTVSLVLTSAVTLTNADINLEGGIINVTGTLIVSNSVGLASSTAFNPQSKANVTLKESLDGANTLTVGGQGNLALGGTLGGTGGRTTVNVVPSATVTELHGFVISKGSSVNAKGGKVIKQP